MATVDLQDYVSGSEAARMLGLSPSTVKWYAYSRRLDFTRMPNGSRIFRRADIEALGRARRERLLGQLGALD